MAVHRDRLLARRISCLVFFFLQDFSSFYKHPRQKISGEVAIVDDRDAYNHTISGIFLCLKHFNCMYTGDRHADAGVTERAS